MQQPLMDLGMRPLSLGELTDRAVTLAVRHWAPFTIVVALATLPSFAAALFVDLEHAGRGESFVLRSLAGLVQPVGFVSVAAMIAQIYDGRAKRWGEALRTGLSKLPAIVGVTLTMYAIFIIPLFLLLAATLFAFGALRANLPAAIGAATIPALLFAACVAIFYFIAGIALAAITIEGCGVGEAVAKGWSFVFAKGRFLRALGMAVAVAGIFVGGYYGGLSLARELYPFSITGAVCARYLVAGALDVLGNSCAVVFYFDLRMRYEAFDIERSLLTLQAKATA